MAEGLGRERWGHTALLAELLFNAHRDPRKSGAKHARDFNPYAERNGAVDATPTSGGVVRVDENTIGLMRQAFTHRKP